MGGDFSRALLFKQHFSFTKKNTSGSKIHYVKLSVACWADLVLAQVTLETLLPVLFTGCRPDRSYYLGSVFPSLNFRYPFDVLHDASKRLPPDQTAPSQQAQIFCISISPTGLDCAIKNRHRIQIGQTGNPPAWPIKLLKGNVPSQAAETVRTVRPAQGAGVQDLGSAQLSSGRKSAYANAQNDPPSAVLSAIAGLACPSVGKSLCLSRCRMSDTVPGKITARKALPCLPGIRTPELKTPLAKLR